VGARLAAIGPLSRDVVDGEPPRAGGAVFYGARAMARLGADARVGVSCAAPDWEELEPFPARFPLPVTWYETPTTIAYCFHYEGEHRIMRQDAVGEPWLAERALDAVGEAEWVHVGALVRTDFPEVTLEALARGGRRLLVDAQGLVRTAELGELRYEGDVGGSLRHVHVLKVNDEEAEILAGVASPEAVAQLGVPEILLTLGSGGSWVIADGEATQLPAHEVASDVDPTGAGDTFSAAYLVARAEGQAPVDAAERATAAVAEFLRERS
jgi:sugar/nucleoside kinase (ribokinase family)